MDLALDNGAARLSELRTPAGELKGFVLVCVPGESSEGERFSIVTELARQLLPPPICTEFTIPVDFEKETK